VFGSLANKLGPDDLSPVTTGLGARPDGNKKLADLIPDIKPNRTRVSGRTVDPVGHQ
jgi:hypothetical protein